MPSKAEKILERMRQTKAGWSDRDLFVVYSGFGFLSREGKHTVYAHPDHSDLTAVVPRGNDLPPVYAAHAVKLIDELLRRRSTEEK